MPEKIRSFIAISLPQEIRDFLGSLEEDFNKTGADVKWVKPENIHLTLKFLGPQDTKRIKAIKEILDGLAVDKSCFEVELTHLGGFPKLEYAQVLWVGLTTGDKETKIIADELEDKISKLGIPKEKRAFLSHITIGRLRSSLNRERLVAAIKNCIIPKEKLKFTVTKITLYKSTLTPQGPIYEAVHEVSLKKI